MSEFKFGPGVRNTLTWIAIVLSFTFGTILGYKLALFAGKDAEVAVLYSDALQQQELLNSRKLAEARFNAEMAQIDRRKLHGCANMRMSDFFQLRSGSESAEAKSSTD